MVEYPGGKYVFNPFTLVYTEITHTQNNTMVLLVAGFIYEYHALKQILDTELYALGQ